MTDQTSLRIREDRPSRRGFLGLCTKVGVAVVAGLSGMLSRQSVVMAHNYDCSLAKPHNPGCAYNCWRYAGSGYHGYAWTSPSGHNWCFECTTGTSCWNGSFLCSEWGHM